MGTLGIRVTILFKTDRPARKPAWVHTCVCHPSSSPAVVKPVIPFFDLRRDATIINVGPLKVPVASIEHLIAMKTGTGRSKDVIDIEDLRKFQRRWVNPRRFAVTRKYRPRSLSDLKNRSEKIAEREQNLIIFSAIVFPIAEKISELWSAQVFLQPIPFKSDRLLAVHVGL